MTDEAVPGEFDGEFAQLLERARRLADDLYDVLAGTWRNEFPTSTVIRVVYGDCPPI